MSAERGGLREAIGDWAREMCEEAVQQGFEAGWQKGHVDTLEHGRRALEPSSEGIRQNEVPYVLIVGHEMDGFPDDALLTQTQGMPYEDDEGRTHWEGCWRERGHHNCAVAMVERLTQAQEPVGEVSGWVESEGERLLEVLTTRAVPIGTKLYAEPVQAQEPVAWRRRMVHLDLDGQADPWAYFDGPSPPDAPPYTPGNVERHQEALYASPVASAPEEKLADVAGRMKAYGYDAETLRVLTEHIFGGAEIPMPASAPDSDDPNFDTFGDQVALEVLCRVFDEWEPIWDEWLESGRDGFIWWGRALGAFIRKNLRASAPEEERERNVVPEPRWLTTELARRAWKDGYAEALIRLRATLTEEQTDG